MTLVQHVISSRISIIEVVKSQSGIYKIKIRLLLVAMSVSIDPVLLTIQLKTVADTN